jgi:hypothetical protein
VVLACPSWTAIETEGVEDKAMKIVGVGYDTTVSKMTEGELFVSRGDS